MSAENVSSPLRAGVVRPLPPSALSQEIETAVLRHELGARLGHVTLVAPAAGAGRDSDPFEWSGPVDAILDDPDLSRPDRVPLSPLFSRTVDPVAADVRERMLRLLGVLPPPSVLDDNALDSIDFPLAAVDFWLVARASERVELTDPGLAAVADVGVSRAIDDVLDRAVADASWNDAAVRDRVMARLIAERDQAHADAADATARSRDLERAALEHVRVLEAENVELQGRLDRQEHP